MSCTVRRPLPHPTPGRRNAFLTTPTHSEKPIDRNEISSILSISYGPTPRRAHRAADAAQLRPAVRRAAVAAPGRQPARQLRHLHRLHHAAADDRPLRRWHPSGGAGAAAGHGRTLPGAPAGQVVRQRPGPPRERRQRPPRQPAVADRRGPRAGQRAGRPIDRPAPGRVRRAFHG